MKTVTKWVVPAALAFSLAAAGPVLAQGQSSGPQRQDPAYACSISVPANTPNAQLAALAKITAAQAEAAAKAAVPGTVTGIRLENENGCLVYSVQISGGGKTTDVKVDAGNGKVVHQGQANGEEEEEGENEGD